MISRKYKVWLFLCSAIISFASYAAQNKQNEMCNFIDAIGALLSLGSNEKFSDKMIRNRDQLYDALLRSKRCSNNDWKQIVINRYEAYTEQEISKKDLNEQIVQDCQYAIERFNKINTIQKFDCLIVDGHVRVLEDGKWQRLIECNKFFSGGLLCLSPQATQDCIGFQLTLASTLFSNCVIHIPSDSGIQSLLETHFSTDKCKILLQQKEPEQQQREQKKDAISSQGWFSVRNILYVSALCVVLGALYYHTQKFVHVS